MNDPTDRTGPRLVLAVAASLFLLEWVPSFLGPYGYFIDELYYLACAARPAWGYVDHPPLSVLILGASRRLLGDSLPALRLLPALAGAATVVLAGALARRLGAGAFGQGLTAVATMFAPIPLIMFGIYSMNGFEMLLWTAMFYVLVVLLERDEPRWWLLFGLLAGLGLLNKHTTVLLGAAVALGVLLSPVRRHIATPWPWLGAGIAAMILAPNLWWQHVHDWPSLEFYCNADLYKNVPTPPLQVLIQQILFYNPGAFPLWLAGLIFFLRSSRGRPHRVIGWACAGLLIMMIVSQKSRPDRIAAIYPVLFAGGAVWIELLARRHRLGWVKPVSLLLIVGAGLVFLPLVAPVLPPDVTARYASATGIVPQIESGEGKVSELPQWLADRFGWEELTDDVAAAVENVDPAERDRMIILVPTYGHAGAIELFGRGRGLPPVYASQNTYYLWGPPEDPVEVAVVMGFGEESLLQMFETVEVVGMHDCEWCMPWRDETPVFVARGQKVLFRDAWPAFKNYQ